jgi:hypothetical protein
VRFAHGAPRGMLRRLEASLILPSLLGGENAADEDQQALIRSIVQEGFAQTYAWNLGEAA